MSTNYYLRKRGVGIEEARQFGSHIELEREEDGEASYVHICKISDEWPISFEANPLMHSAQDVREFLKAHPDWTIRDEFDATYSPRHFFEIVEEWQACFLEKRPIPKEAYEMNWGLVEWLDPEGYLFRDYVFC